MDIAKIDKNFSIETKVEREGLLFFDVLQEPFSVYGVKMDDGHYCRMPKEVAAATNAGVLRLYDNTAGGFAL